MAVILKTMSSNNKSDFGFLVFLGLAVIVLVTLGFGVNSFNDLLKIGKILLIIVCCLAVLGIGAFIYLFIRRRQKGAKKRIKTKKESKRKEAKVDSEKKELKIEIEELKETEQQSSNT